MDAVLEFPNGNKSHKITSKICSDAASVFHASAAVCRQLDVKLQEFVRVGDAYFNKDSLGTESASWQVPERKMYSDFHEESFSHGLGWGISNSVACDPESAETPNESAFLNWVGKKAWFPVATNECVFRVVVFRGKNSCDFDEKEVSHDWGTVQFDCSKYLLKQAKGCSAHTRFVETFRLLEHSEGLDPKSLEAACDAWSSTTFCLADSSRKGFKVIGNSRQVADDTHDIAARLHACDIPKYPSTFTLKLKGVDLKVCFVSKGKLGNLWLVDSGVSAQSNIETVLFSCFASMLGYLI